MLAIDIAQACLCVMDITLIEQLFLFTARQSIRAVTDRTEKNSGIVTSFSHALVL